MLEVEFEKIKNVTFLIYNEGSFFSKKDFQLHSSFNPRILNWSYISGGASQSQVMQVVIYWIECYGLEVEQDIFRLMLDTLTLYIDPPATILHHQGGGGAKLV